MIGPSSSKRHVEMWYEQQPGNDTGARKGPWYTKISTIMQKVSLKSIDQVMNFHNVPTIDVKFRNLSLSIERSTPQLEKLHLRGRPQTTEANRILHNVSLDVLVGSLMAIVGTSSIGKVPPLRTSLIRLHYWIWWAIEWRVVGEWKWRDR